MTGTQADFTKSTDTLISAVTDDCDKSPTIGYITMARTNTRTGSNTTGMANPFVSQEQVNERIKSVLTSAIEKIENPSGLQIKVGDTNEIKCQFGNVLNEFNCEIPHSSSISAINSLLYFLFCLNSTFFLPLQTRFTSFQLQDL